MTIIIIIIIIFMQGIYTYIPETNHISREYSVASTLYYYSGDQIKKTEKGWACSTYGIQERCLQGFGRET
jgi:hypothetical protein